MVKNISYSSLGYLVRTRILYSRLPLLLDPRVRMAYICPSFKTFYHFQRNTNFSQFIFGMEKTRSSISLLLIEGLALVRTLAMETGGFHIFFTLSFYLSVVDLLVNPSTVFLMQYLKKTTSGIKPWIFSFTYWCMEMYIFNFM